MNRKHGILSFLTGVILTLLICSLIIPTSAKQIAENAQLFFRDIKIFIDGAEIVPKDVNGNVVEPFIIDGTTYLPVRAVANALGKDVVWDGKTQSVFIGKKDLTQPDNYLDRIQYTDYKEGSYCSFYIINGRIKDYLEKEYTNGLIFYSGHTYLNNPKIDKDDDNANFLIAYPLNSQYKTLMGKIVVPDIIDIVGAKENDANGGEHSAELLFYGDGELLYKATHITKTMPFNFEMDVAGVNNLVIKVVDNDEKTWVALTDLALYE